MTPSARTLKQLRSEGYSANVVERRVPYSHTTIDLFGFIDIVAVREGAPILGVQVTSTSNTSARFKKAVAIPELRLWLSAGGAFEVHGWAKRGKAGKRKLWTLSRRVVTLEDLPNAPAADSA